MILVEHLTRRFGGFVAVDDVNFHLEKGEVVGFLGPNGAGKTTTMRLLTGFLAPSAGRLRVAGRDVQKDALAVRQHIGYLPEAVPLYGEHRVREMLLFQGRLHGLRRGHARRRATEVLERVGLSEREGSVIATLSKGQRQRVGLAVAMLPDPDVLILDEPTSGLDPLQRLEVRSLLRDLASDRTVLISSHILPEIEAVCGRVIILHRGRVAADGAPGSLVDVMEAQTPCRLEVRGAALHSPEERRESMAELHALKGVEQVRCEMLEDGWLRFTLDVVLEPDCDPREAIAGWVRSRALEWRELSLEQASLEKLFARIALELDAPASWNTHQSAP